jgi:peptide/nickel transport system substrate-binding protein
MPEITPDGLSYSITLRQDARWHDGVPVTADDVVFTIQTAQNADYGAPATVRAPWLGVQAQRISDHVVQFRIDAKYAQFSNNLTLGILPKHLWQDIKPINFSLSELNIKPIGSGPFRFKSLTKDNLGHIISYKLEAYDQSHLGRPKLNSIEFRFFDSEDGIIDAFNANDIDNVGYISGNNINKLKFKSRINLEEINMPRYFSVFFNQSQSKALSDKNVRLALNYATDRVDIINRTLNGKAFLVNSPMIGGILDINPNVGTYNYDPEQAASILQTSGWNIGADGIRSKNKDNRLELTITTSTCPST